MKQATINRLGFANAFSGRWTITLHNSRDGQPVQVRFSLDREDPYCQWGSGNDVQGQPDREHLLYRFACALAEFDPNRGDTLVHHHNGENMQIVLDR